MHRAVPLTLACTLAAVTGLHGGEGPDAPGLLDRATAYVHRFVDAFSHVVAEETYVQERTNPSRARRTLRSDFLLARFPGADYWHVFRDVFEVDGTPVRNREDRLLMLFLRPTRDALGRAQELANASARHNLQDIGTVNNPFLAMAVLQHGYRDRFRFRIRGADRALGPAVRTVAFEETHRPTILRQGPNVDLVSRGTLWIDEQTGRVIKTELRLGQRFPVVIVTLFGHDQELGIDVPAEMRDRYPMPGQGAPGYSGGMVRPLEDQEIRGVATYGRFRRFQVTTEERLGH